MAALTPFRQTGPTINVFAVSSAPPAQQAVSVEPQPNQNYVMTCSGGSPAFVASGANAQQALQNCARPTVTGASSVYILLNGSQVTISGPANAFFTAICGGVTGVDVYITPGYGQ